MRKEIGLAVEKLSLGGGGDAAKAILTTDTKIKNLAVQIALGDTPIVIGGIAKGSGMLFPKLKSFNPTRKLC